MKKYSHPLKQSMNKVEPIDISLASCCTSSSATKLIALVDFNLVHQPAYVSDAVIHQNACEQRKLQRHLHTLQNMQNAKRRNMELDEHQFTALHSVVTTSNSAINNNANSSQFTKCASRQIESSYCRSGNAVCDHSREVVAESARHHLRRPIPLQRSLTQPLFPRLRSNTTLQHPLKIEGYTDSTDLRSSCCCTKRPRVRRISHSFPGAVGRQRTAPCGLRYGTMNSVNAPSQRSLLSFPRIATNDCCVASEVKGAGERRRKESVYRNDCSSVDSSAAVPIMCCAKDLCLRKASQDMSHLSVSKTIEDPTLNTRWPEIREDVDSEEHERQSLGIIKCEDGKILLGPRLVQPETRGRNATSDDKAISRIVENADELTIEGECEDGGEDATDANKTMVKFLPRSKQASYLRRTWTTLEYEADSSHL
eukprot:gene15017-16567_t